MRKFILCLLAILLVSGVAFATSIPQTEDPKAGPSVWLKPVYNNSGAALSAGDVVVWDIGNSTGDNDNYVTTTTTAGTYLVAGVVYPSGIAIADYGTIAVKGVVSTNVTNGFQAAGGGAIACTSGTAGKAVACATSDAANFGFSTGAQSSGAALICVNCNK